jgi:hypothetical protein
MPGISLWRLRHRFYLHGPRNPLRLGNLGSKLGQRRRLPTPRILMGISPSLFGASSYDRTLLLRLAHLEA